MEMEPQAAPAQPEPEPALWMLQVTAVLAVPVTVAENCCVLGEPFDGARKAYAGEIEREIEPLEATTEIIALALRELSAWLTAVRLTGLLPGTEPGAK